MSEARVAQSSMRKNEGGKHFIILCAILCSAIDGGLNDGLIGPSLPDLAGLTNTHPEDMTILFTCRAALSMTGSIIMGQLLDKLQACPIMVVALLMQGVTTALTPHLTQLIPLCAISAISSFFNGGISTATYFLTYKVWGAGCGPFLQAVRMLYTLGLTLSPFLAAPFLGHWIWPHDNVTVNSSEPYPDTIYSNLTGRPGVTEDKEWVTHIHKAYLIVSLTNVISITLFTILFFTKNELTKVKHKQLSTSEPGNTEEQQSRYPCISGFHFTLLTSFILMTIISGGIEVTLAGLWMTFSTEYLGWAQTEGVLLSSLYQGAKLGVGVVSILLAQWLKPQVFVCIDATLLVLSASLLLAFTSTKEVVWVAAMVMSCGMANMFASNISWLGTRIPVSGKVSAGFNISFGVGVMTLPRLSGFLLTRMGRVGLPYVILGSALAFFICVASTWLLMKCNPPDQTDENTNGTKT